MKKIPKRKKVYKVRTKKAEKGIKQRNFETWTKFPDYEKNKKHSHCRLPNDTKISSFEKL